MGGVLWEVQLRTIGNRNSLGSATLMCVSVCVCVVLYTTPFSSSNIIYSNIKHPITTNFPFTIALLFSKLIIVITANIK